MSHTSQIFSQRLFMIFSGILLCFLLLGYQLVLQQQTRFVLSQEQQRVRAQLDMLGEFVAYAWAHNSEHDIPPLLQHWLKSHPDIHYLKIDHQSESLFEWQPQSHHLTPALSTQDMMLIKVSTNAYEVSLDIEMHLNTQYIHHALKQQEWKLLLVALLIFVCLSVVLWILLSRIALRPLDQVIHQQLNEFQQLNHTLEQEKSFANILLNATHAMILVLDPQGKPLQANHSFYHLTGYKKEELTALSLAHIFPHFTGSLAPSSVEEHSAMQYAETPLLRKDGGQLCVDCVCDIQLDEKQHSKYVIFTCLDITERKQDENRLRQAAAVFENTAEGVVITDLQGGIIKTNKAFTDTTGYSFDEAKGKTPALLQSGQQDHDFYKSMWNNLEEHGHWQGEIINRRKSGEIYHEWLTISSVLNEFEQPVNYVGVFSDISAIKQSEKKIDYLSQHNDLTGLPNRLLFNDRLAHALQRAIRDQLRMAVIMMDLDRLKDINTTLGHEKGDDIIKRFAKRLQDTVRSEDTVAHLGGDEFAIIVEDIPNTDHATRIANNILSVFKKEYLMDDKEIYVSGSIGISLCPNDGSDGDTLTQNAKTAMYQAKQGGGNNYQFYMSEMNTQSLELLLLESNLRKALERDEFQVFYQPQFDLKQKKLIGMEALIRWFHPEQGMISPAHFIPLAEESHLIVDIGHWVLRTACAQTKVWHDKGFKKLKVAVNLSARQFSHGHLAEDVAQILEETGLKAPFLKLELTESILIQEENSVIDTLQALQEMGVTLAIDDFGTGYSSLSYLKRFPIAELKIDQSFVRDIEDLKQDAEIVSAIISLGQRLHLGIVAEGIESQTQIEFLHKQGCHTGQGYFFSRPIDTLAFEAFLHEQVD